MVTHFFATWSLEDPVFEPETTDGRLVPVDPNAGIATVGFDDYLRLETIVDLVNMGAPVPVPRQSMTLAMLAGEVQAIYTTDEALFHELISELDGRDGHRFFIFDPATGSRTPYGPSSDGGAPDEDPFDDPATAGPVPDRIGPVVSVEGGSVQINGATDFHLADLGDDGFVVLWKGLATEATTEQINSGIGAQVFGPDGSIITADIRVDPDIASRPNAPVATELADGGFVVVWHDDFANIMGSGPAIQARLHDPDGTPRGEAFAVNTDTATWQDMPSVAGLADGGFVVAWQEGRVQSSNPSIRSRLFDADGAPRGEEFVVESPSQIEISLPGVSVSLPAVAAFPDGGFAVVYRVEGEGLALQIFDEDGTQAVAETPVNETGSSFIGHGNIDVDVFPDGRFVVVWDGGRRPTVSEPEGREVYARIFARDGSPLTSETVVNSVTYLNQTDPRVAVLSDDRFVVTWNDASRLEFDRFGSIAKAQVFDGEGNRHGGEFVVPAEPAERGGNAPHVVALPDDRFAIMWLEHGMSGKVQFQIFDAEQLVERDGDGPAMPLPDDPGAVLPGIDIDPAEAGTGPFRLLAWEGSGLGGLELGEIDGATVAVTGEAQRATVEAIFASLGVTVEFVLQESFADTLQQFSTGEADFLVVPTAGMPEALPAGLVALPDELFEIKGFTGVIGVGRAGSLPEGLLVVFEPDGDAAPVEVELDAFGKFTLAIEAPARGWFKADVPAEVATAVTTADALATLRLAVGLSLASGHETTAGDLIAADFLGSGLVTTADALAVLRVAVGLSSDAAPRYVFVDAALAESPASSPAVPDFSVISGSEPLQLQAILVGDLA